MAPNLIVFLDICFPPFFQCKIRRDLGLSVDVLERFAPKNSAHDGEGLWRRCRRIGVGGYGERITKKGDEEKENKGQGYFM